MSGNLRPKSNFCFLKPTQSQQSKRADKVVTPGIVDMKLLRSENEGLKNVIKELKAELEKSRELNEKKDHEIQDIENELLTVLSEMVKTKKENDLLKAQVKIQQCVIECEMFPLLINENCPADIAILDNLESGQGHPPTKADTCVGAEGTVPLSETNQSTPSVNEESHAGISMEGLNMTVQMFDSPPDERKPHERVPIPEEAFDSWDKLLHDRNAFTLMKSSYLAINLKDIKKFLKKCITNTFAGSFIPKIHFEPVNSFNDSNVLACLIEAVQEKFKEKNLDDMEARKEIIAAFRRIRDAKSKQQQ